MSQNSNDALLGDTHPELYLSYLGGAISLDVFHIRRRSDDEDVGQARYYLRGNNWREQYLCWESAVGYNEELSVPGDMPLIVKPDQDEDEEGFRVPGWSTVDQLMDYLKARTDANHQSDAGLVPAEDGATLGSCGGGQGT